MRLKPKRGGPRAPAGSAALRRRGLTEPYLTRALWAIEGHLYELYARRLQSLDDEHLSAALASSDPDSPLWGEYLQVSYLENAREGLLTTLQALRRPHGRSECDHTGIPEGNH